jgi:hypothetical protein
MKIVVSYLLILFFPISILAQDEILSKPSKKQYGFHLGINYPILFYKNLPQNAFTFNEPGLLLGISGNFRINSILELAPKTELAFNRGNVVFNYVDQSSTFYKISPITANIVMHARFGNLNKKSSPYFLIGPQIMLPFDQNKTSSASFPTKTNVALDLGIGLNKPFSKFSFLPELKYSLGLVNVNQNPALQSLNFHSVSLVFNFMG